MIENLYVLEHEADDVAVGSPKRFSLRRNFRRSTGVNDHVHVHRIHDLRVFSFFAIFTSSSSSSSPFSSLSSSFNLWRPINDVLWRSRTFSGTKGVGIGNSECPLMVHNLGGLCSCNRNYSRKICLFSGTGAGWDWLSLRDNKGQHFYTTRVLNRPDGNVRA